jgi:hypothetical protein
MVDTSFSTGYPFFDIFIGMVVFFAWILYIWIAISVLVDIFRRHDISGWVKAAWVIVVVIFNWLGVLIYLIVFHDGMRDRRMKEVQAAQSQFDEYVRSVAGGPAAEIEKAKQLLDSGTITQAQFDAIKAKALG